MLFAHNDDMGLGALEAIEAAGKVPGKDIKIITIDAVKDGMQALADGKFNFIAECSPLLGPQLMDLAKKVARRRDGPDADRDRGDHLHPGAGQGGAAHPQVLIPTPRRSGSVRRRRGQDGPTTQGPARTRGRAHATPILTMTGISKSLPRRPGPRRTSTSGSSRARSTPSWARTAPASPP